MKYTATRNLPALMLVCCITGYSISAPALDNPDAPDYVSEFLNRAQVHESNIQETTYHTQGYISAYAHYENFLDQELNKAYERLMGHLDEDAQQTLRDSQRNWLKYRDAEFEFIALNWTPGNFGSSSVISRGDYRTTLIKDRVRVGSRMIE